MSRFDCDITKDLLPLYVDSVCSKKSCECIEEHLKECNNCREELRKLRECPEIPVVEADMKKAVKNAGKRIKKGKKKVIIESVALALIVALLISTVTIYRVILNNAITEYNSYSNMEGGFTNETEIIKGKAVNKSDYEDSEVSLFVGEEYTLKVTEGEGEYAVDNIRFNLSDNKTIILVEPEYVAKDSMNNYLKGYIFPLARPFVIWGMKYMGYDADFSPGYDMSLFEYVLETDPPKPSFFCSVEEYSKAILYYSVANMSFPVASGNIVVKNLDYYCIGYKLLRNDETMYAFEIQSKDNIDKKYSFMFRGFESQEEVIKIVSSLEIK